LPRGHRYIQITAGLRGLEPPPPVTPKPLSLKTILYGTAYLGEAKCKLVHLKILILSL